MMSLYQSKRLSSKRPALILMPASDTEKAVEIAVSLLKHKNPLTVETLKKLLTFIPNPNHIKAVLTTAVVKLIDTCPQTAFWLFQHPEVLEPEIQVRDIIAQALMNKVMTWGYTSVDFHFTANHTLEISETVKESLFSHQLMPSNEPSLTLIRALAMQ